MTVANTPLAGLAAMVLAVATAAAGEEFDCLMDPAEMLELGSPVTGLLKEVLVRQGDVVEAGQVVARLESLVEEATVDLLRTRAASRAVIEAQEKQMEMIGKRYERISVLRERGVATEDAFDQVESERIATQSLLAQAILNQEIAEKELARAEVALAQREIRSPLDGLVAERVLSAGEHVSVDDHILRIVQLDPLRIEAFLPVSLFGTVAVGDAATVRPVAPLEGAYEARVAAIDRVFDAASGTFVVHLDLPNPEGALPAGHRCRLELSTDPQEG